jgi:hypothetical protein
MLRSTGRAKKLADLCSRRTNTVTGLDVGGHCLRRAGSVMRPEVHVPEASSQHERAAETEDEPLMQGLVLELSATLVVRVAAGAVAAHVGSVILTH